MSRVAVFIDGSYLDHVLDDKKHGRKINFSKLISNIVSKAGSDKEINSGILLPLFAISTQSTD